MKTFSTISLMMALLAAATVARAQGYGSGSGDGYLVYRSSTPAEAAARGLADVVRSLGQSALSTSQAAILASEARRNQIENQDKWLHTYYNLRQAARAYQAVERGRHPSLEDLIRYAQAGKPDRLSPGELNVATGELSWPILLTGKLFDHRRTELNELFGRRAIANANGSAKLMPAEDYLKARQTTEAMKAELRQRIRQLPAGDYMAAKRFLVSVAYEAKLPVGPLPGIAADLEVRQR